MTEWPLVPPGVWLGVDRPPLDAPGPALFLDRDGVVVDDPGFLKDPGDVRLVQGITDLIGAASAADIPAVVVTNQSGIARGLFGWAEFAAVQAEITRLLAADNARLDAVAACPFHPEFTPDYGPDHTIWRKPGPGMLDLLADRLNIDRSGSWLVGDRLRDIQAAAAAGLAGAVLLNARNDDDRRDTRALASDRFRDRCRWRSGPSLEGDFCRS